MSLYERYIELKNKAREAMVNGELAKYMKLLIEVEEMQLVLVKVKK